MRVTLVLIHFDEVIRRIIYYHKTILFLLFVFQFFIHLLNEIAQVGN